MQHPLHPTGKPVAEFFGHRWLRSKDLIAMGLIPNRVTLNRMIRDGEFPRPLRLTSRVLLWDSTEIAALIDRLNGERDGGEKKPVADETTGKNFDDDYDNNSGLQTATSQPEMKKKKEAADVPFS
jgi:predicted DNA-binding transcriptional regulator AlpA